MKKSSLTSIGMGMIWLMPWMAGAQFTETPAFILGGITAPIYVAVGDLNGDSKPDLAVSVRAPGTNWAMARKNDRVDIFYQKAGTYALPADIQLAVTYPLCIQIGDFDRDGTNDLAVLTMDSPIHVFAGAERFAKDHAQGSPNAARSGPIACRLNTAGKYDFLAGPVWFKWHGGDGFSQGYFYGPRENDNIHSQPADLNLDDVPDAILTPKSCKAIRLYYGPFMILNVFPQDLSQYVELPTPLSFGHGLAIGDFNGDNRPDILAASSDSRNPAEHKIFMFYQNAPLGFATNIPPRCLEGITGSMAVSDVNRDGLDDLVLSNANAEGIYLFLQKKGQPFATSVKQADQLLKVGARGVGLAPADFNGDGFPDIVVWDNKGTIKGFITSR